MYLKISLAAAALISWGAVETHPLEDQEAKVLDSIQRQISDPELCALTQEIASLAFKSKFTADSFESQAAQLGKWGGKLSVHCDLIARFGVQPRTIREELATVGHSPVEVKEQPQPKVIKLASESDKVAAKVFSDACDHCRRMTSQAVHLNDLFLIALLNAESHHGKLSPIVISDSQIHEVSTPGWPSEIYKAPSLATRSELLFAETVFKRANRVLEKSIARLSYSELESLVDESRREAEQEVKKHGLVRSWWASEERLTSDRPDWYSIDGAVAKEFDTN